MLCLAQISRTFFSRRRSLLSLDSSFSKSVNIISTSWSVGDTSASKSLRKFIFIFSFRGFMLTYFGGKRESIFYLERFFIYYSTILLLSTCQVVCGNSYTIICGIYHYPYIMLIEKWVGYPFMSYIPRKVSREVYSKVSREVYRKVSRQNSRGRFSNTIWVLESLKIFYV